MSYIRGNYMVVMFFVLACFSACMMCSMDETDYYACGSHSDSFDLGSKYEIGGDVGLGILLGNSMYQLNLENRLCCSSPVNSEFSVAKGVQPDTTFPQRSNRGVNVSSYCFILKSLCGILDDCLSENEEISPHRLDSGLFFFYKPLLASLKVANVGYEPYFSNSQFYPCNISQIIENEISAWISFSSENSSNWTKAFCCMDSFEGLKPHNNWEVGAHRTQTLIELDFPYHSRGKMFHSFLKSYEDNIIGMVSVFFEALMPWGGGKTVISVSLRNDAPYVLSVVKISGIGETIMPFEIKYTKGVVIFPGTVTQVAFIELHDPPPEISDINTKSCKLLVLTNDSRSPRIEIPCKDVVSFCSRHHSYLEYEHGNSRTWTLRRGIKSTTQVEALDMAEEADKLLFENTRSQATIKELHTKNIPLEVKISGSDFKFDDFVVPMKATIPIPMITSNLCEESVLWTRVKKPSVAIFFVGSTMFLVICFIQGHISVSTQTGKSSQLHLNPEPIHEIAISCERNEVLKSVGEENKTVIPTFPHVEDLKPENLSVKIGKEKGRRRRKKKGSNSGLHLGVSSQSSNSTPSSPLSPASDFGKTTEARSPFAHVAGRSSEKSAITNNAPKDISTAPKVYVKPFVPNVICPPQVSTSTIAPYARAPGSKFYDQKRVKSEETRVNDDKFRYDIWGDHLFGLHTIGTKGNKVYATYGTENNSDSFFVKGPQALMTNYKLKSVSSLQAV